MEVDKGVPGKPKVRSRFVCHEFARGHTLDDMFAPTLPLFATRWLLSEVASKGRRGPGDQRLMAFYFSRAYSYVDCERELYIELLNDDDRKGKDVVGFLHKALYGTQDAPVLWQRLVRRIMIDHGFEASRTTACAYFLLTGVESRNRSQGSRACRRLFVDRRSSRAGAATLRSSRGV